MAKVLVVDDHPLNRDMLVTLLGYRGHTVVAAADGAEGLRTARREQPDLVITDLVMPVMDGYELVRELRADPVLAATRVIFYTANYLLDEVRPAAAAAGVRHVVAKPTEPDALLAVIEDVLRSAPDPPAPVPDAFQREHLRAVSAKLIDKVRELEGAQSALRESEARFRSLAESAPVGIFSFGPDGRLTYANPRLRAIVGVGDEASTPDWNWTEQVHDDDRGRVADGLRAAVARSLAHRDRACVVRPDGELRWIDLEAAPVRGDGTRHDYVGTVADVTSLVLAESQRQALEARLRRTERLESLGQLAAGIAHDFNNLLGVIVNYADFVATGVERLATAPDAPGADQLRDDIAAIRQAADRAAALTRQLLVFAKHEITQAVVIDVNDVVAASTVLLRRTIGEHIELESRLAPDLWPVSADRSRLEQVLVNLVVNARDAVAERGRVVIVTDNVEIDAESAGRYGIGAGRYARLTVTDDGVGMSEATAARAFDPFFTTKPTGQGTGLGLASVYGIVTQFGGSASIYSEPGKGTSVRVYLPAVSGSPEPEVTASADVAGGAGQSVLVVEDDDALRAVTERILVGDGYTVVAVSGGEAAVEILADPSRTVDLVLTDVVMPQMSGREVGEQARALRPGTPVLFMSGYAEALAGSEVAPGDRIDLVEKPFTRVTLLAAIARSLAHASTAS